MSMRLDETHDVTAEPSEEPAAGLTWRVVGPATRSMTHGLEIATVGRTQRRAEFAILDIYLSRPFRVQSVQRETRRR